YVSRSSSVVGPYEPIAALSGNSSSYTDNTVSDESSYYYVVGAAPGLSDNHSNVATATTVLAPPANLHAAVATANDVSDITFDWLNQSLASYNFVLERKDPGSDDFAVVVPDTYGNSIQDSGLIDGATYQYRARTKDAAGNLS